MEDGAGVNGLPAVAGVPAGGFGCSSMEADVSGDGGAAGTVGAVADRSGFFASSAFVQPPPEMSAAKSNIQTISVRVLFILFHFAEFPRRI